MRSVRTVVMALCVVVWLAARAEAQPVLGPFSWQFQPYCNVVTMTATLRGNVFALDGVDDQCGAATHAAVNGIAFPNPDGSVGLGLVIVMTPGAATLHVDVTVSLATGSGTWRDSRGDSGTFALGQRTGGTPRSVLTEEIALTAFQGVPEFQARKSFGTPAAPQPVTPGLSLGAFSGNGWDGGRFGLGAYLSFSSAEAWTPTAHGAGVSLFTVPNGSIVPLRRMTVTQDGRVGIGTPLPTDVLHVDGEVRVNSCVRNSGGGAIAGACFSDARLKHSVRPLVPALDRVSRLRPVAFSWRAAEFPTQGFGSQREIGLVAQEVEAVFPALVATSPEGWKTVDYSALPILAVQAIKELKAKNDAMEQQLAAIGIALSELAAAVKNDRR
jgi:hypothetical protein